jgi:hypothetical protein
MMGSAPVALLTEGDRGCGLTAVAISQSERESIIKRARQQLVERSRVRSSR